MTCPRVFHVFQNNLAGKIGSLQTPIARIPADAWEWRVTASLKVVNCLVRLKASLFWRGLRYAGLVSLTVWTLQHPSSVSCRSLFLTSFPNSREVLSKLCRSVALSRRLRNPAPMSWATSGKTYTPASFVLIKEASCLSRSVEAVVMPATEITLMRSSSCTRSGTFDATAETNVRRTGAD